MSFRAASLRFTFGLHDASFELPSHGLIAVTGPNGAGKSTLLGVLAGLRTPYQGSCSYAGKELREWKRRDFARRVAFLPQSLHIEFPFTAEQVAYMGRTPYAGGWFESPEDHAAVAKALEETDTATLRARDFRELSGGERQRVIIASALAQEPETMLLDEPATFLDLRHQLAIYRLLHKASRNGMLVITVTHDLRIARAFSDRMLVLDQGRLVKDGPPKDVLDADLLNRVFGVESLDLEAP